MDITIPVEAQLHLERLLYDLRAHYYALQLCVDDDDENWFDIRNWLMLNRIHALGETVEALRAFGDALGL